MNQTIVKAMAFPQSDTLFSNPYAEAKAAQNFRTAEIATGRCLINGWRFQGQIAKDLKSGYGIITNKNELPTGTIPVRNIVYHCEAMQFLMTGIYPVLVHGVDVPCIGYFWSKPHIHPTHVERNSVYQYGIVCYANDGDANAYARKQYKEWISAN